MFLLSPTHFATTTESTKDPQTVSLFSIIFFFSNTNVKTAPPTLSLAPAAKERKQKKERKERKEQERTQQGYQQGKEKNRKAPNPQKFQNTQFPKQSFIYRYIPG